MRKNKAVKENIDEKKGKQLTEKGSGEEQITHKTKLTGTSKLG